MKAELEELSQPEADVSNLKQKVDDLSVQQCEQDSSNQAKRYVKGFKQMTCDGWRGEGSCVPFEKQKRTNTN